MSRNFLSYPFSAFAGKPFSRAINLCHGTAVPITIDWSVYSVGTAKPNYGVLLNLQASASNIIAAGFKINAVYIDNLGSTVPIYVLFPDTGFTVAAAPNTACWYPAVTNELQANVYGLGFVTGSIPTTKLFFTDILIQPYADVEIQNVFPQFLGSPVIQRANALTPGFGPAALGDQFASEDLSVITAGPPAGFPLDKVILPNVPAGGFFYICAMALYSSLDLVTWNVAGGLKTANLRGSLCDITNGTIIQRFVLSVFANAVVEGASVNLNIFSVSGLNFRLDAAHSYGLRYSSFTATGGGTITASNFNINGFIGFTYNTN